MTKKRLGKGLGALLDTDGLEEQKQHSIQEIKTSEIGPNKKQPRKNFDEEKLKVLSESIKLHGVIQPIIVKQLENGFYQIIAGERRWRAARLAGLKEIPVVIKEYNKKEVMEIALIENLQREDLNPIEESEAYKNLMDEYALTQEQISERVGKSRSAIANSLRLLHLCEEVKMMLIEDKISNGHARAFLALEEKEHQIELAHKAVNEQLSVRQIEKQVKVMQAEKQKKQQKKEYQNDNFTYHLKEIENTLSQQFGTKVKIQPGKNKSKIEIEYYSNDDLDRLLQLMQRQ